MTREDRIARTFADFRARRRAALVGYLTAFDPDRETSYARISAALRAGVDVLELGVPFSDPTADGPVVQGAMLRARAAGATLAGVLQLATRLRAEHPQVPIVLFSYANPLLRLGEEVGARLSGAGIDAALVVDLPAEHAAELREPLRAASVGWVGLVAPTTPAQRLPGAAAVATAFVYAVTLRGVTGAALDADRSELSDQLRALRAHTTLPIAAGFGVRTPQQAATLARHADGVVVGSALIEASQRGEDELVATVGSLAAALAREEAGP
ncbi:tryptophan synthase subunit alpha [Paraliomyxa miuraensis]|uniref:tryptophan synthase subunit alpha n=1 Tax=Paraliomyxa miuraensis TaxID=376150 RepID=UPI002259E4C2|nr:tryptophan synthase subunit alpha [Paraliomyxa miuraensis]MCX4245752.1 tryptophan synthase subunit alpha [Paraliomyxa miuraensis]